MAGGVDPVPPPPPQPNRSMAKASADKAKSGVRRTFRRGAPRARRERLRAIAAESRMTMGARGGQGRVYREAIPADVCVATITVKLAVWPDESGTCDGLMLQFAFEGTCEQVKVTVPE